MAIDPFAAKRIQKHFTISQSHRVSHKLGAFAQKYRGDPAVKNFTSLLRRHILGRLSGCEFDGDDHSDFSSDDLATIHILNQQIYEVRTCQVSYMTYNICHNYDIIHSVFNSKNYAKWLGSIDTTPHCDEDAVPSPIIQKCDVMVLAPETEDGLPTHPYWYAWMEFLWVHWFGDEHGYCSGPRAARLPKIIQGCHLIPCFKEDWDNALLCYSPSIARPIGDQDDCGGIGHPETNTLDLTVFRRSTSDGSIYIDAVKDDEEDDDGGAEVEDNSSDIELEQDNNDLDEDDNGMDDGEGDFPPEHVDSDWDTDNDSKCILDDDNWDGLTNF
ncbi:hypothetical protein FISHEDRAFT_71733 [Fistulina hepatica ATCC 64428]|uniref:Uncharacterized protein n=1 Tax=Fistulina hepatica ATCC 64428 TaxID=1128425 RepID=A0A0D7AHQ9_9AGAR|nr:hypothetical protein FISHEDRAFT_71733 [Fistulina hepatica ATCC 64428]